MRAEASRLTPAVSTSAQRRAAIVHQIEFDEAATAIELEIALARAIRRVFASRDDGTIGLDVVIAHASHEGETFVETPFVQIVEKKPADAAWLVAVLEEKILVAPFFITRIDVLAEGRAGLARDTVPVHGVLLEAVV